MRSIFRWLLLLILVVYLLPLISKHSYWVDLVYVPYIYHYYSTSMTWVFGKIPFSVGDVFYVVAGLFILYKIFIIVKSKQNRWKNLTVGVLKTSTLFLFIFNLCWGFNNYRTPLHQKMKLETTYSLQDLEHLTVLLTHRALQLQEQLTQNPAQKVIVANEPMHFYAQALKGYQNTSLIFQLPLSTLSPVKSSLFSIPLTQMGFSGYFNPFTHEAQINSNIPVLSMPVTIAHEMAHKAGIASESEANFIAFMVMYHQEHIAYQYAATLYALRYCLKQWELIDPQKSEEFRAGVSLGIRTNLEETDAFWREHKNITTSAFKIIYGNFLKLNHQKEGMKSYNRFVDILINYEKKKPFL